MNDIMQSLFIMIFTHCVIPTYRNLFLQYSNQIIKYNLLIISIHLETFYSKQFLRFNEIDYVHIQSCL